MSKTENSYRLVAQQPTEKPTVFSGDIKDSATGMKTIFTVTFHDQGELLTVEGIDPGGKECK